MAEEEKKENAIIRYFRDTRAELRKVHWPTRQQAWSMTRIVLAVTFGMAVFLGVLDFLFERLMQEIIARSFVFGVLGLVVLLAILGAAYWIGQGEEA